MWYNSHYILNYSFRFAFVGVHVHLTKNSPDKNQKPTIVMFQCSLCTAGSSFCSLDPDKTCAACGIYTPHICSMCISEASGVMPKTCYLCKARGHIRRENSKPTCQCTKGPIRLQVIKKGNNKGKYFWTCRDCNMFQWEQ